MIPYWKDMTYFNNGKIRSVLYYECDKDSLRPFPFANTEAGKERVDYDMSLSFTKLKCHGKQTEYYKNGNIRSEAPIVNGKKNGLVRAYYEDGTIAVEGFAINDLEEGGFKFYSKTGEIQTTDVWEKGIRIKKGPRLKITKHKKKQKDK